MLCPNCKKDFIVKPYKTMRGSKAKKIRSLVYGDLSFRYRKYFTIPVGKGSVMIVADQKRKEYQLMKARQVI